MASVRISQVDIAAHSTLHSTILQLQSIASWII